MTILAAEGCGNSPKNIFLESYALALFRPDAGLLTSGTVAQATWNQIGSKTLEGIEALLTGVVSWFSQPIVKLIIHPAVCHGRRGAVDVQATLANGEVWSVGIFVLFANSKGDQISYLKTFTIQEKKG